MSSEQQCTRLESKLGYAFMSLTPRTNKLFCWGFRHDGLPVFVRSHSALTSKIQGQVATGPANSRPLRRFLTLLVALARTPVQPSARPKTAAGAVGQKISVVFRHQGRAAHQSGT